MGQRGNGQNTQRPMYQDISLTSSYLDSLTTSLASAFCVLPTSLTAEYTTPQHQCLHCQSRRIAVHPSLHTSLLAFTSLAPTSFASTYFLAFTSLLWSTSLFVFTLLPRPHLHPPSYIPPLPRCSHTYSVPSPRLPPLQFSSTQLRHPRPLP